MEMTRDNLMSLASLTRSFADMAGHHDTTASKMEHFIRKFVRPLYSASDTAGMSEKDRSADREMKDQIHAIQALLKALPRSAQADIPLLQLAFVTGKMGREVAAAMLHQGAGQAVQAAAKAVLESVSSDPKALAERVKSSGINPEDVDQLNKSLDRLGVKISFSCA